MEWSKQEKVIAKRVFDSAYERECLSIAQEVRKKTEKVSGPSDLWKIHDYLTEKRNETDQKYDYRYSVLLSVFARLLCEGWIREEDLEGLSGDKLQEIQRIARVRNIILK